MQRRAKKTNKTEPAMKSCRDCSEWQAMKEKLRVSELLLSAIESFEKKMKAADFKPTMSDYLKLLQMEREMEHEGPKEIKVTWVDPKETSVSEK
ncbi:MAG: hypothetical protein C5B51_17270 [Terriglobia bacterium]|nr:MAG: hypothetical protein C5B51_17270 [Terriglobia bacterium]